MAGLPRNLDQCVILKPSIQETPSRESSIPAEGDDADRSIPSPESRELKSTQDDDEAQVESNTTHSPVEHATPELDKRRISEAEMGSIETRNRSGSTQPKQAEGDANGAERSGDRNSKADEAGEGTGEELPAVDLKDQEEQEEQRTRSDHSPDWALLLHRKPRLAAARANERTYLQYVSPYGDGTPSSSKERARTSVKRRRGKDGDTSNEQASPSPPSHRNLSQSPETSGKKSAKSKASHSDGRNKPKAVAKRGRPSKRKADIDPDETEEASFTELHSTSDRKKAAKKRKQMDEKEVGDDSDAQASESNDNGDATIEEQAKCGASKRPKKQVRARAGPQEKTEREEAGHSNQEESKPHATDSAACEAGEEADHPQSKSNGRQSARNIAQGDAPHQDSSQTLLEEPPRIETGEAQMPAQSSEALEPAADGETAAERAAAEKMRQEKIAEEEAAREAEYMKNREVEVDDGVDPDHIEQEWKSRGYFDSTRSQIRRDFMEQTDLHDRFWKKAEEIAAKHLQTLSEKEMQRLKPGKIGRERREQYFTKIVTELPEMQRLMDDLWDEFTQKSNAVTLDATQAANHAEQAGAKDLSFKTAHESVQEDQVVTALNNANGDGEVLFQNAIATAGKSPTNSGAQRSDDSPKRSRSMSVDRGNTEEAGQHGRGRSLPPVLGSLSSTWLGGQGITLLARARKPSYFEAGGKYELKIREDLRRTIREVRAEKAASRTAAEAMEREKEALAPTPSTGSGCTLVTPMHPSSNNNGRSPGGPSPLITPKFQSAPTRENLPTGTASSSSSLQIPRRPTNGSPSGNPVRPPVVPLRPFIGTGIPLPLGGPKPLSSSKYTPGNPREPRPSTINAWTSQRPPRRDSSKNVLALLPESKKPRR